MNISRWQEMRQEPMTEGVWVVKEGKWQKV